MKITYNFNQVDISTAPTFRARCGFILSHIWWTVAQRCGFEQHSAVEWVYNCVLTKYIGEGHWALIEWANPTFFVFGRSWFSSEFQKFYTVVLVILSHIQRLIEFLLLS